MISYINPEITKKSYLKQMKSNEYLLTQTFLVRKEHSTLVLCPPVRKIIMCVQVKYVIKT